MDERVLLVEDDPSTGRSRALGSHSPAFASRPRATAETGSCSSATSASTSSCSTSCSRSSTGTRSAADQGREPRADHHLSAKSDTVDVVVGLELGADDYVTKPFELPELVARARAAVSAPLRSPRTRFSPAEPRDRPRRVRRPEERRGDQPDRDRVQASPRAGTETGSGIHARAPPRARIELRVPRRLAPRRRGRPAAAGQGRRRPEGTEAPQDGSGSRLPLRRRIAVADRTAIAPVLATAPHDRCCCSSQGSRRGSRSRLVRNRA